MENLTKWDRRWIKSMQFCRRWFNCHQMPERSFFIKGYQFPLCARCTGMLFGYIIALIFIPFFHFNLWILLLCIPLAIDGGIQYITSYESNNLRRFLTGILYGFGFCSAMIFLVRMLIG